MDFTGHIVGLAKDFNSKLWHITLEMDSDTALETIQNYGQYAKLNVHIAKWRKKRSLDANAYMWALLTRMASVLKTTKEELYERFLTENDLYYRDDEGYVVITLPSRVDVSKIEGHWKFIKKLDDKFSSYAMLKGSSMMDTKEFSELLDTIVREARDLGIETETDCDLQLMLEEWGRQYEKRHHN